MDPGDSSLEAQGSDGSDAEAASGRGEQGERGRGGFRGDAMDFSRLGMIGKRQSPSLAGGPEALSGCSPQEAPISPLGPAPP